MLYAGAWGQGPGIYFYFFLRLARRRNVGTFETDERLWKELLYNKGMEVQISQQLNQCVGTRGPKTT